MEQRNCKKCGKVFVYISGYPLCKECKTNDEEEYKKVREYIRQNPGVKIAQVSEALNISHFQILRYLREERLLVSDKDNVLIYCDLCGASIRTGRFCDSCKSDINKTLRLEENEAASNVYYYNDEQENKIRHMKHTNKNDKK